MKTLVTLVLFFVVFFKVLDYAIAMSTLQQGFLLILWIVVGISVVAMPTLLAVRMKARS